MSEEKNVMNARLSLLVSFVLLVGVLLAGALKSVSEPRRSAAPLQAEPSALAVFALDRDQLREEELRQLESIATDATASDEIRNEAQKRRMELMSWMEQEASIARVLAARGFETPVVTVHADSVNVLVRAESLSREEANVILELATRETGVSGGNVKVIPVS